MRSSLLIPLLATLATALPTTSTHAIAVAKTLLAHAPPEAKAVVKSVSSSGTGCASNSAAFLIKDDATLAFDSLTVDGSTAAEASKKCTITLDLQLDKKWKYTINKSSEVKGYTDGASAGFKSVYSIGSKTSESSAKINSKDAKDGNYLLKFKQDGVASAYGGGVATIDVSVSFDRQGAAGVVTVDSVDIGFAYST